ncbi:hypothetical protein HRH33_12935 [Pseudomonas rhodesiae]|jgi:hypothetical protein|uniref:hypothetical protein n=1 Tax=Pseudomonas rhodesiae TaxID=76760 RepID=UPI00054B786C|nr:hypothetical protein [Pseudomonas rhodesiae]QKJ73444.1 hypothetical protein HRH33_12935 [Pseudomonas rhodesiae]
MDLNQRNHQTAVSWIEGEIENMILDLGKPNASAAATSCVTLAFMLRVIDDNEHRYFRARIDKIYANYNASIVYAA